jgi:hypothetical protein|tara:strand:+ start:1827 stop:1985 length:159 start_codon:yes stop_codon:yes gene_type:complete
MELDRGILAIIGIALGIVGLVIYVRYENKRQVKALNDIDNKIKGNNLKPNKR